MKFNKIMLLMAALMILCIVPFTAAEENETSDDVSENETLALNSTVGAQMRLTQLSLAIEKSIAKGEEVIRQLSNTTNSSKNLTKLEEILDQMRLLLDEVNSTDPSSADRVETFVSLKSQARELAKQFRDEARSLVDSKKADELREKIKDKTNRRIEDLKKKVNERKIEFNRLYAEKILQLLGINDTATLDKLKDLNVSFKDIREEIKDKVQNMTKEERKNGFMELRENELKQKVATRQMIDRVKLKVMQEREDKLKDRIEKNKDRLQTIREDRSGKNLDNVERSGENAGSRMNQRERRSAESDDDDSENETDDSGRDSDSDNDSDDESDDDSDNSGSDDKGGDDQ